jgi:antitoxin component of MazEF toxin-antitoxin module
MKRSIWFRRTISLGESVIVTIPAELVKKWGVNVGEQMCWSLDHGVVTVKPSRLAVQYDEEARKVLERLRRKEERESWRTKQPSA